MPDIVDKSLDVIFYVQGEASDCKQVVGVCRVEGNDSKGYGSRRPDSSVE